MPDTANKTKDERKGEEVTPHNTVGRAPATNDDACGEIPEGMPLLITIGDASRVANCSEQFMRDMCRRGIVKAVKLGGSWRVNRDALFKFCGIA